MESFNYIKSVVLNLRMESCCWVFPVRIGLIITAFFNAMMAIISIFLTANETFHTVLIQVQIKLNEETATTTVPMLAYITEVGFSVLCLCGIFRKDRVLLNVYMNYCIAALVLSLMVYSLVILAIDWLTAIVMIFAIAFQVYVLLLVRSAIVEIKWEKKQSELPTLIMSSLVEKETKDVSDISIKSQDLKEESKVDQIPEITVETISDEPKTDDVEHVTEPELERKNGNKKEIETKLETVTEEVSP